MAIISMAYSPISYDIVRQGTAGHRSRKTVVSHGSGPTYLSKYIDVQRQA